MKLMRGFGFKNRTFSEIFPGQGGPKKRFSSVVAKYAANLRLIEEKPTLIPAYLRITPFNQFFLS